MGKSVFVFVVAIIMAIKQEFIMQKKLQTIEIPVTFLEFQLMFLGGNVPVRNHLVGKTIVSALELEFLVELSVSVLIAEMENLTLMNLIWEDMAWRSK